MIYENAILVYRYHVFHADINAKYFLPQNRAFTLRFHYPPQKAFKGRLHNKTITGSKDSTNKNEMVLKSEVWKSFKMSLTSFELSAGSVPIFARGLKGNAEWTRPENILEFSYIFRAEKLR